MSTKSYLYACACLAAVAATPGIRAASTCAATSPTDETAITKAWRDHVTRLNWVCYQPSRGNPDQGIQPTAEDLRADLTVLRKAGFDGIVTYGAGGVLGGELVRAAEAAGLRGIIMGLWNPTSSAERAAARAAAQHPLVLGFCVGNEGLGQRYSLDELRRSIAELRQATGKPVTTTEEIDDYLSDELLAVGDWVFPNAHPYFHGRAEWGAALRWTQGAYDELARRSGRFVWFKELGLPTAGDQKDRVSAADQRRYYVELAESPVMFAYFEAFDQTWKTWSPFEPHWGLFQADRTPKALAEQFLQQGPPKRTDVGRIDTVPTSAPATRPARARLYIYRDAGAAENHFRPTGYDGDCGDVQVDEHCTVNPHSGQTCLRLVYRPEGRGPHKCAYDPPCRWASLRWQHPPGNWGDEARWAGKGLDLSGYRRLVFWARADAPCRVRFSVGGVDDRHGDSLAYPRRVLADLTPRWQAFRIDLRGADLRHIISGFAWDTNWNANPDGVTLYLDDAYFE